MELATLRRLHSATGVFPLGAYLSFHAWEHWPVRHGRDALFARLASTTSAGLELALVLLPLAVHAVLGLRLARATAEPAPYASPAFRRLQRATGVLAAGFLALHLGGAWLPRLREPNPLGAAYSAMLEQVGRLPGLAFYIVGVAAVCTHFGQGLGCALIRFAPARLSARGARLLGILVGVSLWLMFVNELASYASYAPLL